MRKSGNLSGPLHLTCVDATNTASSNMKLEAGDV